MHYRDFDKNSSGRTRIFEWHPRSKDNRMSVQDDEKQNVRKPEEKINKKPVPIWSLKIPQNEIVTEWAELCYCVLDLNSYSCKIKYSKNSLKRQKIQSNSINHF